jgi:FKBP-type peptidyl-prolyl cis-trans isomerase
MRFFIFQSILRHKGLRRRNARNDSSLRPHLEALEDRFLPATGTLGGTAFIDHNTNGIFDTGEVVLPGVTVTLTGTPTTGGAVNSVVTTNASGNFSFTNVPAGTYQLTTGTMPGLPGGAPAFTNANAPAGTALVSGINFGDGQNLTQNLGFLGLAPASISLRQFLSTTTSADFPDTRLTPGSGTTQVPTTTPTPTPTPTPSAPAFTSGTPSIGTAGQPYSFQFTASGSPAATFSVTAGSTLPSWASLNASTGILSGTPPAAENDTFSITATNSAGSVSTNVSLQVAAADANGLTTVSPLANDPHFQTLPSGVKIWDVQVGSGATATSTSGTVYYAGFLASGGTEFDSSAQHGNTGGSGGLSVSGTIPGFMDGVAGMQVGGIRNVFIPAALAYGNNPPPGIPVNADLIFQIKLLSVP